MRASILMQASSDIFLGWVHVETGIDGQPRDFYGRQLKDWKGSFETAGALPEGMGLYGRVCGWTLARAHARSGDRIAIASYLGGGDVFDRAIADFSVAYADQNERDYARAQEGSRGWSHRGSNGSLVRRTTDLLPCFARYIDSAHRDATRSRSNASQGGNDHGDWASTAACVGRSASRISTVR